MRAVLLAVTTALAPALLFTAPAHANGSAAPVAATVASMSDTPVDEMSQDELRAAIAAILAHEDTGRGVAREANKALNGTVDDMRTFLKTGYRLAQAEDDQVAIARILYTATQNKDKRVINEANKLLETRSPEEMRAWLKTGYRLAQAEDDAVHIARILYTATQNKDKRVINEANKLLETRSPEEMRAWLKTGYRLAQAEDDAFYIVRMLAAPNISDALRAAANAALDDGSPETLRYFRQVGQYEVAG
ncbi:ALF repeat-containing protein [Streptomyces sp. NPDC048751]|uniref:ALF repeat-containing protein n=1 Tax=Streptomyces sp. NPDC048751 TaxID=3365591 RepID=UPI0037241EEF